MSWTSTAAWCRDPPVVFQNLAAGDGLANSHWVSSIIYQLVLLQQSCTNPMFLTNLLGYILCPTMLVLVLWCAPLWCAPSRKSIYIAMDIVGGQGRH